MQMQSRGGLCVVTFLVVVALSGVSVPSVAGEHTEQADAGGIDVQTFRPAAGPQPLMGVETTGTAEHLHPYGGLFVDYLTNPLMLVYDDGTREPALDDRLTGTMVLGMGLSDRFQLELAAPVVLVNRGEYLDAPLGFSGLSDLQARAKAQLWSADELPVAVGAGLDVSVPTGRAERFGGAGGPTMTPRLVADARVSTPAGPLVVAMNTGVRAGATQTVQDIEFGPRVVYGVGAGLEVVDETVELSTELQGAAGIAELRRETSPLEMLSGVKFRFADGFAATVGGGAGLVSGVGSPEWRGVVGMSYAPTFSDEPPADTPTEQHVAAECPPEPEGFDGPYDEEGCPVTPETFTGCDGLDDDWQGAVDEWGCPLLDSDGDGLVVWEDDCSHEPMVFIEGADRDGCPDHDVDGDGVPNVEDHCPLQPGLRAYDGCPPPEDEEVAERGEGVIEIEERVHFEKDKAVITEESYEVLEQVGMVLHEHSDIREVEVAGHTDELGDSDYNMMLSKERARAVREFLIERANISPARVTAEGYGETEPIVAEDTAEARAENRRVEFRIVETSDERESARD